MAWIFVDEQGDAWLCPTIPILDDITGTYEVPRNSTGISYHLIKRIVNTEVRSISDPIEIVVKPKETNPIDVSDALKDAYKGGFEAATQVLLAAYEGIKTR